MRESLEEGVRRCTKGESLDLDLGEAVGLGDPLVQDQAEKAGLGFR
jgi:hypothetical protein